MAIGADQMDEMPVIPDPKNFDRRTGNTLERLVFNYRRLFISACAVITAILAFQIRHLVVNANFDRVIPQSHPYIQNYFKYRQDLSGQENTVRIAAVNTKGSAYDPAFLEITRKLNDRLYLLPGVNRPGMKSIWMAGVRWTEVTEEGFRGGPVMPDTFDGSPESIESLRRNVRVAGVAGSLVGTDEKSIMYVVPLIDQDPVSGARLDYGALSRRLEQDIRQKFASDSVQIKIVGFAKLVGDLIEGLREVMLYFLAAAAIAAGILFAYTRCIRSTALVLAASIVAVVWQLGIVSALRFEIDPYSVLVPFLVFAVGVSHGAQKMNGIMQDIGRGTHKYVAARYTFRRLFVAGLTALMADAVGFAVLVIIDVPVIKDLALTASIGVAVLVFTNLLLLPVMLSYTGVSHAAALRALAEEEGERRGEGAGWLWGTLARFSGRRWALGILVGASVLTVAAGVVATKVRFGDLDPGAPELRPNSRYNKDVGYLNAKYTLSSDQFIVMVKTPAERCSAYETLKETERLGEELRQLPGVIHTSSLADHIAATTSGFNEGNPKWRSITRNHFMRGGALQWVSGEHPDVVNRECSLIPLKAYLADHKADTLERVVATVDAFAAQHDENDLKFLQAAGTAGIEAVTNMVVRESILKMYLAVYGAVALLCFITFRSWRAVVVAMAPLVITSILCKALMVVLGIGLKVSTLPVIALGVGIGVDYSLYLLSVQLAQQRAGRSLGEAYKRALAFTGKVVGLVGMTISAGVVSWAWSPIKFQADMGVLLTFMMLWNMIGALFLIPALSHFLLNTQSASLADERPCEAAAKT